MFTRRTAAPVVFVCSLAVGYAALAQTGPSQPAAPAFPTEWAKYGHDATGQRFSPVGQITPGNVGQLQVAWTYHMKPPAAPVPAGETAPAAGRGRGGSGFAHGQATPIVANGVMYTATPYSRVVALEPTTGKEIWVYQLDSGAPSQRGVEYFPGDAQTPPQVIVGTNNGRLISLDAKTGKPRETFGEAGIVNMNTPEILNGLPGNNPISSPPTMYKHLILVGGRTSESPAKGPAGDVRAVDVHTGKIVWTFKSIPQAGEKGNETWAPDSWRQRTGVNVWSVLTVDNERGIVYMPFGAPSVDQYGGDRAGDNLYGTSLVAADANTGKYLWHFQVVHHDVWDGDLTAPPALFDVKQGGRTIPAVAAIGKTGLLFILDRETGKPIYGVEERPVPQSEVPLERTSKTQPFPLKPPPLARTTMSMADIATVTPELEAVCRKLSEGLKMGGPYEPPSFDRLRVNFPGNHGGVNWGGVSVNPQLGYLFVNTNNMGQIEGFTTKDPSAPRGRGDGGVGNRIDPAAPYSILPGGGRFRDNATNMMCQQPPWGQLNAVNVHTGEIAWQVPLGVTDSLPADKQKTGRPGNGGTITTAGGLVFVGATDDARFRAFDGKTGKELWTHKLVAAAVATPLSYLGRDGKQYVVVMATGGGILETPLTDDSIIAFALPAGIK